MMRINGKRIGRGGFPFEAIFAASRGFDAGRHWGDWDGDDMRRHGRKNRRRVFGNGELRLALLKLISDQPRHGYELIKAVGDLTGGTYEPSPGAVYPTLSLLADEGAIRESKSGKGDEARKAFKITEDGEKELEERAEEIEAILARLASMSGREERNKAPELFRAMGNLAGVLKHKYRSGGFAEKDLEEIVDILDEAAKRIERL